MLNNILENNWIDYKNDLYPKDRRMKILSDKDINGMESENIKFLINELVKNYAKNGTYLEIGIYKGSSLLSAALFNECTRCIGIDNFSEFNRDKTNENELKENLKKFDNPKNIEYYNIDYKEGIKKIFEKEPNLKIDVYFYDGEHSYENQLTGLNIMLPYFSEKCIIITDDFNWDATKKANNIFLENNKEFKSILQITTNKNGSEDWWNGIEIIKR